MRLFSCDLVIVTVVGNTWLATDSIYAILMIWRNTIYLGPVVQSIVSLTSLLRGQLVKCFTTL